MTLKLEIKIFIENSSVWINTYLYSISIMFILLADEFYKHFRSLVFRKLVTFETEQEHNVNTKFIF